jgi:hypothetical protein
MKHKNQRGQPITARAVIWKIAQRFNAGFAASRREKSRQGRQKFGRL